VCQYSCEAVVAGHGDTCGVCQKTLWIGKEVGWMCSDHRLRCAKCWFQFMLATMNVPRVSEIG
jgi:hypothetical protein